MASHSPGRCTGFGWQRNTVIVRRSSSAAGFTIGAWRSGRPPSRQGQVGQRVADHGQHPVAVWSSNRMPCSFCVVDFFSHWKGDIAFRHCPKSYAALSCQGAKWGKGAGGGLELLHLFLWLGFLTPKTIKFALMGKGGIDPTLCIRPVCRKNFERRHPLKLIALPLSEQYPISVAPFVSLAPHFR